MKEISLFGKLVDHVPRAKLVLLERMSFGQDSSLVTSNERNLRLPATLFHSTSHPEYGAIHILDRIFVSRKCVFKETG